MAWLGELKLFVWERDGAEIIMKLGWGGKKVSLGIRAHGWVQRYLPRFANMEYGQECQRTRQGLVRLTTLCDISFCELSQHRPCSFMERLIHILPPWLCIIVPYPLSPSTIGFPPNTNPHQKQTDMISKHPTSLWKHCLGGQTCPQNCTLATTPNKTKQNKKPT